MSLRLIDNYVLVRQKLTSIIVDYSVENSSFAGVDGRYPVVDASILDTTDLAAIASWHVLQAFLGGLPSLDSNVTSKEFNLWTER